MEGGIEGYFDDEAEITNILSFFSHGLSFRKAVVIAFASVIVYQLFFHPVHLYQTEDAHIPENGLPSTEGYEQTLSGFFTSINRAVPRLVRFVREKTSRHFLVENDEEKKVNLIKYEKNYNPTSNPPIFNFSVLWMAPFVSGGGYCSEAISYVSSLHSSHLLPHLTIAQHGDAFDSKFWNGLPVTTRQMLQTLSSSQQPLNLKKTVIVCHSEPGAWYPPLYQTVPCPPQGYGEKEAMYVIGRTMFETDRVNPEHVERCNRMDEIWVPTEFHVRTFSQSGVNKSKLVKVVQAVDVDASFNPSLTPNLPLPSAAEMFMHNENKNRIEKSKNHNNNNDDSDNSSKLKSSPFVFLSIFKWETRKGWDILLKAYLEEFTAKDDVLLYLLTNAYHSDAKFKNKIEKYVKESGLAEPAPGWPRIQVRDQHVPQTRLPSLYKAADCFVLPSRGEGWGRPCVEAMAMELPVIATNWSGMTEYMNENNSYPLEVEGLVVVEEGAFRGHRWAQPSLLHLKRRMREVYGDEEGRRRKAERARRDMVRMYSPEVVAEKVMNEFKRIREKLAL